MNPYYLGGMLMGALLPAIIISRVLLFGAKGWALSAWKLFYINILSAMICILLAIIGNAVSAGGVLSNVGESIAVYGFAQCLVLAFDLLRYQRKTRSLVVPEQHRVEPRF